MSESGQVHLPYPAGYALRRPPAPTTTDRVLRRAIAPLVAIASGSQAALLRPTVRQVLHFEKEMKALDDARLLAEARHAGVQLRRQGTAVGCARLFAAVREVAARQVGLGAYPVQVRAAVAIWNGLIVEMATGEGKTLVAALAAAAAALSGRQVHVVTVNDYLTGRDATLMSPLFDALGLDVGVITSQVADDDRPARYRCSVVYVCNKELGFDFLRDRVAETDGKLPPPEVAGLLGSGTPQRRIPGLLFAIVDEVDSILVDEARTPLILSGSAELEIDQETCLRALDAAASLQPDLDFTLSSKTRQARLTATGLRRLDALFENAPGRWASALFRDEMITQAIAARFLIERDRDYIVRDGKVEIIDEFTGRTMPDRNWRRGLHQLIETKEGLELTEPRVTLGYITYQSLFRRYDRLSGMSGTVAESAGELWQVFGSRTVRIPPHRKVSRTILPPQTFRRRDAKLRAVAERAIELSHRGAPVLVGTRTVATSNEVAELLADRHARFALLNAVQDADEAAIVARAGEPGQITIATNMAGRGTDIVLGAGSREAGGLHVLMTEKHETVRIDRQLAGRCARQGDPGVFQAFISLEDELVAPGRLPGWLSVARQLADVFPPLIPLVARSAQRRLEILHTQARRRLLKTEGHLDRSLAITGSRE